MDISLIVIGDELLIGQVVDTNSAHIARMLYSLGLTIRRKYTVSDEAGEIKAALAAAMETSDMLLLTGGLGPTKDDITKEVLAGFLGRSLVFSQESEQHLKAILEPRGIPINDLQLRQCYVPEGSTLLDNQMGTAMGLWIEQQGKFIACMPGVPFEMEYIMRNGILPRLESRFTPRGYQHKTICTVGMGETEIAGRIEPALQNLPSYLKLAYLPALGQVRIRITGSHSDPSLLHQEIEKARSTIDEVLQGNVLGYDEDTLEEVIGRMLRAGNTSLSTAESCTGGSIAQRITRIAGASDYFRGSIVAYQNELKTSLLDVPEELIMKEGVVSESCVREMVKGCCRQMGSTYAIASSGIAGPGGGSAQIPVGTIWIAWGTEQEVYTRKFQFFRDRSRNIESAVQMALLNFWKYLVSKES